MQGTNKFINKILNANYINKTISIYKNIENKILNVTNIFARFLIKIKISANTISVIGFIIGMFAVNFLSYERYTYAFLFILFNRFFDILDGAIAKETKVTKFGTFLDYILDYIFYSAIIFGFAIARIENNAIYASFMLFAFLSSAVSFSIYAILDNNKSSFYLKAFNQAGEVILAILLSCIFSRAFYIFAIFSGVISIIKTLSVITAAYYQFEIIGNKTTNVKK